MPQKNRRKSFQRKSASRSISEVLREKDDITFSADRSYLGITGKVIRHQHCNGWCFFILIIT